MGPTASTAGLSGKNLAISPADLDGMLPRSEAASEARTDAAKDVMHKADAAYQNGVWMPDSSRHTVGMEVDKDALAKGTMLVEPKDGKRTLRIAYSFSGVTRKASIGDDLRKLCEKRVRPPDL